MTDPARRSRAHPAPSSTVVSCKWTNFTLAVLALPVFAIALQAQYQRAPCGFFLATPLFLLQVLLGLIPAVVLVRREKLVGSERWWLLAPAISGPLLSAAAIVVSVSTAGGC